MVASRKGNIRYQRASPPKKPKRTAFLGRFATAINCIDGRTQIPLINYLKETYEVNYVDMITEPGPVRVLSENEDKTVLNSIKQRAEISMRKHGSHLIAIVGHHDCAGNPVSRETQLKQILDSVKTVSQWETGVKVVGLWIDENWKVNKINMAASSKMKPK